MSLVQHALDVAKKHYSEKDYSHAIAVMVYVKNNPFVRPDIMERCVCLALMHDLLEDTDYEFEFDVWNERVYKCLRLLTRYEGQDYMDYIKEIKDNAVAYPEAYWVKIADIKDHLSRKETLTKRLKDKYIEALAYLL